MKEFKILAIVIFFTLVTYWGIEPFAHSQMHPLVTSADFKFADLPKMTTKGDASIGATQFIEAGCLGCHGLKSQGIEAPMDSATASQSFGVVPPDLSSAGILYDENFLAQLIKNPVHALKVEHKFNETNTHPMPPFFGLGGELEQEVANIVAYLQSIAPQDIPKEDVYIDACLRCHDLKYAKKINPTLAESLNTYMGTTPPDLSMVIRSKDKEYLRKFINDPQKLLPRTSMPRVGLTKDSQEKVISYLENTGDRKKDERESLGYKLIAFMTIFAIIAYLWKVKIWREVH